MAAPAVQQSRPATRARYPDAIRAAAWLAVPLLAVAAYAAVLRIGFLSDDLLLAYRRQSSGFDWGAFVPGTDWLFYRPVSRFITWEVGWLLWGNDPLPYHLLGLLAHAGTSLALTLWLSEATGSRSLGWLGGALFAVFPLHIEAVGWVAAQWDVWAALFGITGLWLFTLWWRRRTRDGDNRWLVYALSLLCFGLGVFSKESLLTFLPVYALSAWHVTARMGRGEWGRLLLALVPFAGVLTLNVGLRLAFMGNLGGYVGEGTDYATSFWDQFVEKMRVMLAPLNSTVLGEPAVQVVGALSALALLVGLAAFGYELRRLLLVLAAWLVLCLTPVLNLPLQIADLENNRFFYLPAAAYCALVAALLHAAIGRAPAGLRKPLAAVPAALILLSAAASWAHLGPWRTATEIAGDLHTQLLALVPPQERPRGMLWVAEDPPDNYRGAFIYRLGLGGERALAGLDSPWVESVFSVRDTDLSTDGRDVYGLRFAYDRSSDRFRIAYAAGITWDVSVPSGGKVGDGLMLWDFRGCSPEARAEWVAEQAELTCRPGEGLAVNPTSTDPRLILPDLSLDPWADGAKWVRLRVAVRYPNEESPAAKQEGGTDNPPVVNQWFWREAGADWGTRGPTSLNVKADGEPHVYWTFLSPEDVRGTLTGLRFDPINAGTTSEIQWIALDLVR